MSVCLSVGLILDNSRYASRKSKKKFVNQPHPNKIVKIRAFFVFWKKNFMKKSKILILVSDNAHKPLLITQITFFGLTKIRKVTVY